MLRIFVTTSIIICIFPSLSQSHFSLLIFLLLSIPNFSSLPLNLSSCCLPHPSYIPLLSSFLKFLSLSILSLYHTNFAPLSLSLLISLPLLLPLISVSLIRLLSVKLFSSPHFILNFPLSLSLSYLSLPLILELSLSLTPYLIHSNFSLAFVPFLFISFITLSLYLLPLKKSPL